MSDLNLFLPITKADADQRLVYGLATAEIADRDGEICDYQSTKPYYETWSAQMNQASGGKSFGAVRAMHGKVAAGKLTDITFDDGQKRILIAAKIVDDDEWRKVEEGVYTGFSQGGRYVKRWPDPETGAMRYTAEPREISLVDLPCLAAATFDIIKDGIVEKRAFARKAAIATQAPAPIGQAKVEAIDDATQPALALEQLLARAKKLSRKLKARIRALRQVNGAQNSDTSEASEASRQARKSAASLLRTASSPELVKALAETSELRAQLHKLAPEFAALNLRLATLEAQPAPARAALRAFAKSGDSIGAADMASVDDAIRRLADLAPDGRAHALMKLSLASPLATRL